MLYAVRNSVLILIITTVSCENPEEAANCNCSVTGQPVSWSTAGNLTWNETSSTSENGTVNLSNSGENVTILEPSGSASESSSSESLEVKEEKLDNRTCETRRGIFRRKLTLKVGYGYFSFWGCKIKLCNASAQIEIIPCHKIQDLENSAMVEDEINSWKLDCWKHDCAPSWPHDNDCGRGMEHY